MSNSGLTARAIEALRERFDPDQVLVSGPAYEERRRIWNGAVEHRPAVIVRCATPSEVQAAVQVAGAHRLALSVLGAGHDWAGRALRHGGLVIDLSGMRTVTIDAEASVGTLEGGVTAGDVMAAAAPFGLSAATGTVGAVGMAGLTLAGGYGPLSGRFGLALDNLLGATIVLFDGRLVTADAAHEPDLFWALRGGGGNFGVVTSMRIRLHRVDQVLAGFILYPWRQATDTLAGLSEVLTAGPDELTVQVGIMAGPEGGPALMLSPTWSGDDLAEGVRAINRLQGLGTPVLSEVAPMAPADMLRLFDDYVVDGRHYAIRTRSVAAYTPEVISALVDAGASRTSPLTGIYIHHFHGAAAAVPEDSTAFGMRRNHLAVEIVAGWEPDDPDSVQHRAWADSVAAALTPLSLPGGYPNLLGPDDHDQIAGAYGHNAKRLRAVKERFDPEGIFSATPLPRDPNV